MSYKNRIVLFVLSMVILFSALPVNAFAKAVDRGILSTSEECPVKKNIEFSNVATRTPLSAEYSDSLFERNNGYDHELAWLSLCLELSSWTTKAVESWCEGDDYIPGGVKDNDTELVQMRSANIRAAFKDMDFDKVDFYNYGVTLNDTSDKVAYSIASKGDVCGSTLIAVVIRGGLYGGEWKSNFNIGSGEHHEGFYRSALEVYNQVIKEYESTDGKVKLWITGYSRGAAVANVLSAMMCNKSLSEERLDKEDVFAYTFATPKVTANEKASDSLYDGIYNVVNPGDIFSVFIMEEWGFTRYGTTKYINPLSPSDNVIDKELIQQVETDYHKVAYGSLDVKKELEQNALNLSLCNMLTRIFPTAESFGKIERVLSDFVEYSQLMKPSGNENSVSISIEDYHEILNARHGKDYLNAKFAAEVNLRFNDFAILAGVINQELTLLLLTIGEIHELNANELLSVIKSLLEYTKGQREIIGNYYLTEGHSPMVYLAWMMQEEEQIFRDTSIAGATVAEISGSVDLTVYDSDGGITLQISDKKIDHNEIPVIIDGEITRLYFPSFSEEGYTLEIGTNGSEKINYTVSEYEVSGELIRRANYYDVELSQGQTFASKITSLTEFTEEKYDLITQIGSEEIKIPASEIVDSGSGTVRLKLTCVGQGRAEGGGSYVKGDTVNLKAYPDKENLFVGWYINGQLVSSEVNYTLLIRDNIEIKAEFKACEHIWGLLKTTKEATHTEDGENEYSCEICGETRIEITPKISKHTYGEWIECDDGVKRKFCACGHFVSKSVLKESDALVIIISALFGLGGGFTFYILRKKSLDAKENENPDVPSKNEQENIN